MSDKGLEARYFEPVTLRGQHVRLVPLTLDHAGPLFRALDNDEEIWRYIPVARPRSLSEMRAWIEASLDEQARGRRLPFAVLDHCERSGRREHQLREHVRP